MVMIHLPGRRGAPPPQIDPSTGTVTTWSPYSNLRILQILERSIQLLRGLRNARCDSCFRRLPGGRSFTEVFDDPTVFISFDPTSPFRGTTDWVGGREITIGHREFEGNPRIMFSTVASTILHELAHVNGAPETNAQAENTLRCCGMSRLFTGVTG